MRQMKPTIHTWYSLICNFSIFTFKMNSAHAGCNWNYLILIWAFVHVTWYENVTLFLKKFVVILPRFLWHCVWPAWSKRERYCVHWWSYFWGYPQIQEAPGLADFPGDSWIGSGAACVDGQKLWVSSWWLEQTHSNARFTIKYFICRLLI